MLYLRNFEFEDNFCEEVTNNNSAINFESHRSAKEAKAQFINQFPLLEIVDESGGCV